MPTRQKQLLLGLIAAVLLWQGSVWGDRLFLEPLRDLRHQVAERRDRVGQKEDKLTAIELAEAKMMAWQAKSFAPDAGKRTRPEALEAHRQYTAWLTELAHAVGFDEITVVPRSISRKNVYLEVVVQIDGEGRLSQLAELLDRFYRTDLLHRVGRLQISSDDVIGDPPVRFTLEANALALVGVPARGPMFPRTNLADDLGPSATELTVSAGTGFPHKAPFRIRLDRELLDVTSFNGRTWTVARGVERTEPAEHPAKAPLSLVKVARDVTPLGREEFREFVRTNVFVKPTPPMEYDFKFGPFSPPLAIRGRRWDFSIAARDFDPARGEPKYRFVGAIPAGLTLNETTGQLVWKAERDFPAGEYTATVEVKHPSAPNGVVSEELALKFAEPNSTPRFPSLAPQTVYRGLPWKKKVEAKDNDNGQKLTYKFGGSVPSGCVLNETTGEITWTPGDDQALGPLAISITATDDGAPPASSTATVSLKVAEDTAKQTVVIAVGSVNEAPELWLLDRSQNRKSILRVGDELKIADISGVITGIAANQATVRRGSDEYRLRLGDTVRSLSTAEPITRTDSARTLP